jgi:hypothetical protein
MMKLFWAFLFLLMAGFAQAQESLEPANLNYFRFASGGGGLHTLGWHAGGKYGISKSKNLDRVFEFDLWRTKHPKEVKVQNQFFQNPRSYTFGKQYDLFTTHIGYGMHKVIFDKGEKRGVEVRYHVSGGAAIALLKPVYLDVLYQISPNDPLFFTTRTERYDPSKHFADNIYGGSRFREGLNEIRVQPGIYLKSGLMFEWGDFTEEVRMLECGLVADIFPKEVPIMAFAENRKIFLSLYLGVQLGKRW